jgi:hypothetical protein
MNPRNITGMPVSASIITPPCRSLFLTYRPSGCECYCPLGSRSTSLYTCRTVMLWIVTCADWNNICNSLLVSYFRYLSSLIQTSTCQREFHFRSQYFPFGLCNGPPPLSVLHCGCDHTVMKCQYPILFRCISKCSNCTKCCLQHLHSLYCFSLHFIIFTAQMIMYSKKLKLNSVALVRERTIPTERPPPVGEVSANFCW